MNNIPASNPNPPIANQQEFCLAQKFLKYTFVKPNEAKLLKILSDDFTAHATWGWGERKWDNKNAFVEHLKTKMWNKQITVKSGKTRPAPYSATDYQMENVVESIQFGPTINGKYGGTYGKDTTRITFKEENGQLKICRTCASVEVFA